MGGCPRQPLTAFLGRAGVERLDSIPFGVSSVKRLPPEWRHGDGVFVALAAPASAGDAPEAYWRFYPRRPDGSYGEAVMDEVEIFRAIACREAEPRAELDSVPSGPGVFDWELIARAAAELASTLTLQRSQADLARGASERSRKLRTELRGNAAGLGVEGLDDLLERLLQVRVEDFDGRSGWRRFDDARRSLRRAETEGERNAAARASVEHGLDLFGRPISEEEDATDAADVRPEALRLVAYEALLGSPPRPPSGEGQTVLGL